MKDEEVLEFIMTEEVVKLKRAPLRVGVDFIFNPEVLVDRDLTGERLT